jgi:hypothetical protein
VGAGAAPEGRPAVDTTETFELGLESLRAHQQYLAGLGDGADPSEFLEDFARQAGTRLGCRYATSFEVFQLQFD